MTMFELIQTIINFNILNLHYIIKEHHNTKIKLD